MKILNLVLLLLFVETISLFGVVGPPPQVVVPPQGVSVVWDYPEEDLEGVTFNVYYTSDLTQPFSLLTNVISRSVVMPKNQPAGFFVVKAVRDGIESD
jgi:hypothetical protein